MKNQTQFINPGRSNKIESIILCCRKIVLLGPALACLAILPLARAVSPPPDGGYANETTAEGEDALFSLTTGIFNTAVGFHALHADTTGRYNTGVGDSALMSNTTAEANTAVGSYSLSFNTTGIANTAVGAFTLGNNSTGFGNTTVGSYSLAFNTTGGSNTATGYHALFSNTTGVGNTATGDGAIEENTTANFNTAIGFNALNANTTGVTNTAVGYNALLNNISGDSNVAIGRLAGWATTGDNNIDIGNNGIADESGVIRIGAAGTHTATFIAGISGTPITSGVRVGITADGQLGVKASSARFKEEIKPMDKASEVILGLNPVTFHYKKALDPKGQSQFGLVAEDVAKVDPALVVTDEEGKPFTVRYDEVNAMLLNEFLKEHRQVTELKTTLAKQQEQIEQLSAVLEKHVREISK